MSSSANRSSGTLPRSTSTGSAGTGRAAAAGGPGEPACDGGAGRAGGAVLVVVMPGTLPAGSDNPDP